MDQSQQQQQQQQHITQQYFMLHSSQAPGDLQLALRGGGDRGGRVGGRQAGLAGQVPAH